jgi:DNA-binding beta-propeller fold protein YncE
MPKEWYISFHGGDEKISLNNIHVYSTDGKKLRKALNKNSLDGGVKLRELRAFVFGPDKNLYVVNAYFEYSEILKFKGALNKDGQHDFAGVFVKRHADLNPGIDHPFNVAFDSNGDLYVSSQNTNLVARYHGPISKTGRPGMPMPFPESLSLEMEPPPGTFVPSAKLASNGLLDVRKVIFTPNNDFLYVADRAADCVRIYEARTGRYLRNLVSRSDGLDKPIHLLHSPDGRYLLIGSGGNDSILRHDLHENATSVFVESKSGGLNGPAGMAFGDDGFLYVASRNSKEILRYTSDGQPYDEPFVKDLADNPEFLMLVRH